MSSNDRDDHRPSGQASGRVGRSDSYGRNNDYMYHSDQRDSGRGYDSKRAGRAGVIAIDLSYGSDGFA